MATILVVEDDKNTRRLTMVRLRPYYQVVPAEDGEEALNIFYNQHIDLVIADIMMPKMDGYELVRTLREYKKDVPVILLTAKSAFADKKEGFRSGTDDYMTKPVDYEELLWRIEALLRRSHINSSKKITIGNSTLDETSYTLINGTTQTEIPLSKKEFELLFKMLSYPNQIFAKETLLEEIWGMDADCDDSTIKTHINRLRNKLKDVTDFEIVTIRGLGYKARILH